MRFGNVFVLAIVVIALIGAFFQFLINNIAGCSNRLLSQFSSTEVAQVYEKEYLDQIGYKRLPDSKSYYWTIEKNGDGCSATFNIRYFYVGRWKTYHGDKFLINLNEKRIYPITSGAKEFLDFYMFDTKIH